VGGPQGGVILQPPISPSHIPTTTRDHPGYQSLAPSSDHREDSSGPSHRLPDSTDLPPIRVATTPSARLAAWTHYFETLLHRPDPPQVPKPWLDSEISQRFKQKLTGELSSRWPQLMNVTTLDQRLRMGNIMRQATTDFKRVVLTLINFTLPPITSLHD